MLVYQVCCGKMAFKRMFVLQLYIAVCILPHTGLHNRFAMPGEFLLSTLEHILFQILDMRILASYYLIILCLTAVFFVNVVM